MNRTYVAVKRSVNGARNLTSTKPKLFKSDTIIKQAKSDTDKSAVAANNAETVKIESASTPFLRGIHKMNEHELDMHGNKFLTAFFVAKAGKPFIFFPLLCGLYTEHFKFDLTRHYNSNNQSKLFISQIAEIYRQEVKTLLINSDLFSLICDGSTDTYVIQ